MCEVYAPLPNPSSTSIILNNQTFIIRVLEEFNTEETFLSCHLQVVGDEVNLLPKTEVKEEDELPQVRRIIFNIIITLTFLSLPPIIPQQLCGLGTSI